MGGVKKEKDMAEPKLSEAQRRVMKWLGNVDTLMALQRLGLVEQLDGPGPNGKLVGQWKATEEGRALTRRLCL